MIFPLPLLPLGKVLFLESYDTNIQVHRAFLKTGEQVAVKIQYPGVAESISNDLDNLKSILLFGNFLPKGLYLDNTIRVARVELSNECDYIMEAESMETFRALLVNKKELSKFRIPLVYKSFSSRRVLTTEFVSGISIGETLHLPQQKRDEVTFV